jgi:hypothetical protein
VPDRGKLWDPDCLDKHPLLSAFASLVPTLKKRDGFPSLAERSDLFEAQRLRLAPDVPQLAFVEPRQRPRRGRGRGPVQLEDLYEGSIVVRHEVPGFVDGYHDLFNFLVWLAFPKAKWAIHQRQYRAQQSWVPAGASRLPGRRTREQDALTLFDEGGGILLWRRPPSQHGPAFEVSSDVRATFSGAEAALLFGHAVMEHVYYDRPEVRVVSANVLLPAEVRTLDALFPFVDVVLAARLEEQSEFLRPGLDGAMTIVPGDANIEARSGDEVALAAMLPVESAG